MSLRLERVSHRFGKQEVLKNVSLHIERGDCYGFIGHNGAGKTTAMRVLLGLLDPDDGRVVVDGFEANGYPREARARMGALIEQAGFHPGWSGARNLRLLARLGGASADVGSLIEQVGLAHAGDKPVRAYSQGMRQRLGVAQALLGDPDYVLLDEPSNGLDPDGIQEMRALIRRLTQEEGRTVLISSHQLHELEGICNRVGVLRQGQLVMEETIENLLQSDQYRLETDDPEAAVRVIEEMGLHARAASPVSVTLAERKPAEVVRALVGRGVGVSSFSPEAPSLEEIYHRDTAPLPPPPSLEVGPPDPRRAPSMPVGRMVMHELRRWSGQWTTPAMLAAPALAGVLAIWTRVQDVARDAAAVEEGALATATSVNAFEGVARALHPGLWLLGYVLLGLASQSIAGEFGQGTLRNVLLRPVTRVQVALGKGLALLCAALAAYAVLVGVSIATASAFFEWKGVVEILPNGLEFEHRPIDELWPVFYKALQISILPLFAYTAIGFLCGALVRRGATALSLALGTGVALDLGRGFFTNSAIEPWLPMTYLPSELGRYSYIDYMLEWSQGTSGIQYLFEKTEVACPLLWIVAGFLATAWTLKRRYVP
ncbi:MAG: ATP-binding cassette domain-containing protein [Planctomycetota bacterium]